MPKLIGIMGATGAGKSTMCNALAYVLGQGTECFAFASVLKDMARARGWDGTKTPEGRAKLQHVSDEIKREQGSDIFTRTMFNTVLSSVTTSYVVLEDVRFSHEIVTILRRGGLLVLLEDMVAEARWQAACADYAAGDDRAIWCQHESELDWRALAHLAHHKLKIDKGTYGLNRNVAQLVSWIYEDDVCP